MNKSKQTINQRIGKEQTQLLASLEKMPIVEIACQRTGIGRATYYRWRKDNEKFAQAADAALEQGRAYINDLAETNLISLTKDKNWSAIRYWLENNHPRYANKLQVTGADGEPIQFIINYQQDQ